MGDKTGTRAGGEGGNEQAAIEITEENLGLNSENDSQGRVVTRGAHAMKARGELTLRLDDRKTFIGDVLRQKRRHFPS